MARGSVTDADGHLPICGPLMDLGKGLRLSRRGAFLYNQGQRANVVLGDRLVSRAAEESPEHWWITYPHSRRGRRLQDVQDKGVRWGAERALPAICRFVQADISTATVSRLCLRLRLTSRAADTGWFYSRCHGIASVRGPADRDVKPPLSSEGRRYVRSPPLPLSIGANGPGLWCCGWMGKGKPRPVRWVCRAAPLWEGRMGWVLTTWGASVRAHRGILFTGSSILIRVLAVPLSICLSWRWVFHLFDRKTDIGSGFGLSVDRGTWDVGLAFCGGPVDSSASGDGPDSEQLNSQPWKSVHPIWCGGAVNARCQLWKVLFDDGLREWVRGFCSAFFDALSVVDGAMLTRVCLEQGW